MHLLETSLFFRAGRRSLSWVAAVGRDSLIGCALKGTTRAFGRVFASSFTFGTEATSSVALTAEGLPLSVRAVARPYVSLRRVLHDGAPGRSLGRLGSWGENSVFGRGGWVRLVGGAILGMGCGRFALTTTGWATAVSPTLLVIAGALVMAVGPRLMPAFKSSLVFGGSGKAAIPSMSSAAEVADGPATQWVRATGVVLCVAAGVLAGIVDRSGPFWLVSAAVAVFLAVVLLWRPEAVLFGAAAFPWLDWSARHALGGAGAAWDEALLLLALALLLWGSLVTGRVQLRTVPIMLPTMCALTIAVGSVVVCGVPREVGQFAIRVVFEPILFYFVAFLLFSTGRWLRWIIGVYLVSSAGLALHGLYQFAARVPTPTRWVDPSEMGIVTRAFSVIGNPNGLGTVLLIGTLVAISLLIAPGVRKATRLLIGATVIVHVGAIAVTFSRGAWIALVVGLLALLLLAHRRFLLPALLVGVVGLVAAPGVFVSRFLFLFSGTYIGNSAVAGRTIRWDMALDQMAAHPWFGMGLGTYGGSSAERFGYWSTWVDNYYLQMGAEGGVLMLAAFLWLLLRVGKGLAKGYRVAADPFVRALSAGMFGAFVAVAVANVFASTFETLAVGAAFWFLAGLTTSATMSLETTDMAIRS